MTWRAALLLVLLAVVAAGSQNGRSPSAPSAVAESAPAPGVVAEEVPVPPALPAPGIGPVLASGAIDLDGARQRPPPAPEPEPRSFTMAFTGDFLLHQRVSATAAGLAADDPDRSYDYRPLLEPIRPWIEGADWAVCHMEVNLSADGQRLTSYPVFRVPGQIAFDAHDVGYDACSTASNHTLDHGVSGVAETLGVMEDAGLRFTGSARTPTEAAESIWYEVNGVRIAHLSYTYWFNGYTLPDDAPWTSNEIDEARILADTANARIDGAEYVLVSLHWGEQYQNAPNAQQQEVGPRLLASPDVDLIIGHHAHVVQPIDNIDGEWLVYGLGNLLANYSRAAESDELLVSVEVIEQPDGSFDTGLDAVPLHIDRSTMVVHPTDPSLRPDGLSPALNAELDASWDRVRAVLETGSGWDILAPPSIVW